MTISTNGLRLSQKRRFSYRGIRIPLGNQAGQGLVELALSMPLFLLLLVGAAEVARYAWASIEASNAARAGVQYGAQSHITASDTAGIAAAASNDAVNLSGLVVTSTHSCACSTAPTTAITCSTALTTCPAPDKILEYVQVTTSASVTPLAHYPGLPNPFTVQGWATMEVEQ